MTSGAPGLWGEVRGLCPCGLGMPYTACCGRYISGAASAPTAEALMRSRYTAFVVGDAEYITSTWAKETRPKTLEIAPEGEPFTRLTILTKEAGGPFDESGVVEFAVSYPGGVQRERSRFRRHEGRWVYVDGEVHPG